MEVTSIDSAQAEWNRILDKRRKEIVRLRKAGKSFAAIADIYRISRQRVTAIYKAATE